jgi:DUF4097 and DUF4098 domain-containing protein YvlB
MLVAGTGSGDLDFDDHAGGTDLTTSSGDIDLDVTVSPAEVKIGSSSGEVDIVVYGGDSVELDLRTSNGTMMSTIPVVVEEATRKRLLGRGGSGELKINVVTSSGDISVSMGSI